MPLRLILATLLLTACGHAASTDATPATDAALVTDAADASSPRDAAPATDAAPTDAALVTDEATTLPAMAMPVIREAGRRWVVLATNLDDDAGDGAPVLLTLDDGYAVTLRTPHHPARAGELRDAPHTVWAQVDGRACALSLDAPVVLSRAVVDVAVWGAWVGLDEDGVRVRPHLRDDDFAREADAYASGGRVLAAPVRNDACADARIATVSPTAPARFERSEADEALRRRVLTAYRATPAWVDMQRYLHAVGGDEGAPLARNQRWDEYRHHTPEVTVWRGPTGRRFVTVLGFVPAEGCGTFGGGVWALYALDGDALVPLGAEPSGAFDPREVVDADGDGRPEFHGDDEVRAVDGASWRTRTSLAVPSHVCPC